MKHPFWYAEACFTVALIFFGILLCTKEKPTGKSDYEEHEGEDGV